MGVEQFDTWAGSVITRLAKLVEVTASDFDLSLAQYRMLGFLGEGTAASSSLAESMAVTRPSISSLVDGLVARGLVQRGEDPTDRRRQLINLTADGERVAATVDAAVSEHLGLVVAELDDRDAAAARAAFGALRVALDRYRERVRATAVAPAR
jgi:long-chain acyl-CoA synthetase